MDTYPTPTVTLIGYGLAPAKPAQDLHAGDVIIWNYGYKSTVIEIKPRGKTQLTVELFDHKSAKHSFRVMGRTTLVAMKVTL
jgi:hypothetical protein